MRADKNEIYWNSLEPYFKAYPALKSNIETEVVIVGGGINGCLTSYYLYREGFHSTWQYIQRSFCSPA